MNAASSGNLSIPGEALSYEASPWIKGNLTQIVNLDVSSITISTDDMSKTVTLSGSVKSAAQSKQAEAVAAKHAAGYKVLNHLLIAKKS